MLEITPWAFKNDFDLNIICSNSSNKFQKWNSSPNES